MLSRLLQIPRIISRVIAPKILLVIRTIKSTTNVPFPISSECNSFTYRITWKFVYFLDIYFCQGFIINESVRDTLPVCNIAVNYNIWPDKEWLMTTWIFVRYTTDITYDGRN